MTNCTVETAALDQFSTSAQMVLGALLQGKQGVPGVSYSAFRNRLRNASFTINQRNISGVTTLASGAYGHDGLRAGASGATYSFTPTGIDYSINILSGSLILPIEAAMIEGGVYMLSNAGAAQGRVWQGTGYTGVGSYQVVSSAGLTVAGLYPNIQTNVEFSNGTILQPQFEAGANVSPFDRRPPSLELALCQRYFWQMVPNGYESLIVNLQATSSLLVDFKFPAPMRALPTITNNLADANYASSAYPTGAQWILAAAGVSWVAKTGTATFFWANPSISNAILKIIGASYSPTPNVICLGPSVIIKASAEL